MQNDKKYIIGIVIVAAVVLCLSIGYVIPGSPIKAAINGGTSATPVSSPSPTESPAASNMASDQTLPALPQITKGIDMANATASAMVYPEAAAWLAAHPDARITQLYTDHMDINGKATSWNIAYISSGNVMDIIIQNGIVSRCYNYNGSEQMPAMAGKGLIDSPAIMNNLMQKNAELHVSEGSNPFSFYLQPESGTYKVTYVDNVNNNGFVAHFDCVSGDLISQEGLVS